VNIIDGMLHETLEDSLVLLCPSLKYPMKVDYDSPAVEGVPVKIALRPEKIRVVATLPDGRMNCAEGVVDDIAYLGDLSIYYVQLETGQIITAQLQNEDRYRKNMPTYGDRIYLEWDVDSCSVLAV